MNIKQTEPGIYEAMGEASKVINAFGLEPKLLELIRVRASQLNGCGYCINLHTRDALKMGETPQRLFAVSAWWETPFFTDEEQAVLRLTEQLTVVSSSGVTDEVYERAKSLLGEKRLAQVIFAIVAINSWNRIAVSVHMVAERD